MKSHKRRMESKLLARSAHADVFEIGASPSFLFTLFGGSGVDDEEYALRGETILPHFKPLPDALERSGLNLVLVHVTAPYDLPFNRFTTEPAASALWKAHILTELLEPWSSLPYFLSGFSGGAALALNGLHQEPRCFGGGALGADAIPPDFECPAHWAGKLRLYVAPDDRVGNAPENRGIFEALERQGQAEIIPLRAGGHRLADYARADGLGNLIRFASANVPNASSTGNP